MIIARRDTAPERDTADIIPMAEPAADILPGREPPEYFTPHIPRGHSRKPGILLAAVLFLLAAFGLPYLWRTYVAAALGGEAVMPQSFLLRFEETGEVVEIAAVDYVIGCLFAQIPVSYHEEALRAQAVAAYTYALRTVRNNALYPTAEMKGVDLTDSKVTCQAYFTEAEARAYYGADYDAYYDKVRGAAEYGAGHWLSYGGEPIYSVYHSVSSGQTNGAYSVWGRNFPYLQSVPSAWDSSHVNFLCSNEMTVESMRVRLLEYSRSINMPIDYGLWFTEVNANEGGYVETVRIGDTTVSGGDAWRIFNLRSTAFEVTYDGSVFTFVTKGYGHGVGLSQYGANYMAESGYTAREILEYYYTDVTFN